MSKYIKGRIAEINKRLAPVLRRLGQRVTYTRTHSEFIVWLAPTSGNAWCSPVEIVFADRGVTKQSEASWQHAHVNEIVVTRRALGESGWDSWKYWGTDRHEIQGEGDDMFEWLSNFIVDRGLFPDATKVPNCVENSQFGDAYLEMEAAGFENIQIRRHPKLDGGKVIEIMNCTDTEGREICVPMLDGDPFASIYIDGEKYANFHQTDCAKLYGIAVRLMEGGGPAPSLDSSSPR